MIAQDLWALNQIPGIQALKGTALDPARLSAADKAQLASYHNSTASQVGTQIGNGLLGGLAAESGAGALGGALTGAGELVGGVGGQALRASGNLLTGSGAATTGGKVLSSITSGATKGAIAGTALGSNDVQGNALAGAALGPVATAAGAVLRPIASGIGNRLVSLGRGTLNALAAPSEDAAAVGNQLAPGATARCGGSTRRRYGPTSGQCARWCTSHTSGRRSDWPTSCACSRRTRNRQARAARQSWPRAKPCQRASAGGQSHCRSRPGHAGDDRPIADSWRATHARSGKSKRWRGAA